MNKKTPKISNISLDSKVNITSFLKNNKDLANFLSTNKGFDNIKRSDTFISFMVATRLKKEIGLAPRVTVQRCEGVPKKLFDFKVETEQKQKVPVVTLHLKKEEGIEVLNLANQKIEKRVAKAWEKHLPKTAKEFLARIREDWKSINAFNTFAKALDTVKKLSTEQSKLFDYCIAQEIHGKVLKWRPELNQVFLLSTLAKKRPNVFNKEFVKTIMNWEDEVHQAYLLSILAKTRPDLESVLMGFLNDIVDRSDSDYSLTD